MKILYLMSDFPYPPRGGGALRIMGLVTGAAQAGHEVHILSLGQVENTNTPLHEFCKSAEVIPPSQRSRADRIKTLLFSRKADMQTRSWSDAFLVALTRKLRQEAFDIVQFQSLEMGIYLEPVRRMQLAAMLIYDAYNAEAELQRMVYQTDRRSMKRLPLALYSWMQWQRLTDFERRLCQSADGVIAVSDADRVSLSAAAGKTPVWVVNNGIDTADYAAALHVDLGLGKSGLVFTGIMDYRPNVDAAVWFADEILPHVPNARFYIVGSRPHPRVLALAERDNIIVTGFVDDVLPYLHQAAVFVVPLRVGSGTRLKLLQAMSAGCAIVATRVGAMGLDAQHGEQMLLADDAREFADAVKLLLSDAGRRKQLGAAGQMFVKSKFDWSVIVPRLLAVYDALAGYSPESKNPLS